MRNFGIMGVATAALLGLAACGGGGEEKAEAPAAPAAEAPAAAEPAPAAEPAVAPAAPAAGATLQVAGLTGDAAAGQRIFGQCRTCHVVEPGVNRVGPSLHGVVGRTAGTVPGYTYSAANLASDAVWDEATLFTYLENPRGFMPGTKMAFVGLRDPQQRADVIAYLKTQA
jgi:cytochrome c